MNRRAYTARRKEKVLEAGGMSFVGGAGGELVYRFTSESGYGQIRHRLVLPGVDIMYNDYRMASCTSDMRSSGSLFVLDWCREGRLEYRTAGGSRGFFEAGDLSIDRRDGHAGTFEFPLGHYVGVSIGIDLGLIALEQPEVARAMPVDLAALQEKFTKPGERIVLKGDQALKRMMEGLCEVPDGMRQEYYLVKVQEVLLYLDAVEPPSGDAARRYFSKGNVEKVKAMRALMTDDVSRHYTLSDLSEMFGMPLSSLKSCFKGVYGDSVYSYMRSYRAHRAAVMLSENPSASVSEVAAAVGYANQSKFSDAFRAVMGCLPSDYRAEARLAG